jgi:hypothetical protein
MVGRRGGELVLKSRVKWLVLLFQHGWIFLVDVHGRGAVVEAESERAGELLAVGSSGKSWVGKVRTGSCLRTAMRDKARGRRSVGRR